MRIRLPTARKELAGKIIELQCKSINLSRRFLCLSGFKLEEIISALPYGLGEDKMAVVFYSWIEIDESGRPIPKKIRETKNEI